MLVVSFLCVRYEWFALAWRWLAIVSLVYGPGCRSVFISVELCVCAPIVLSLSPSLSPCLVVSSCLRLSVCVCMPCFSFVCLGVSRAFSLSLCVSQVCLCIVLSLHACISATESVSIWFFCIGQFLLLCCLTWFWFFKMEMAIVVVILSCVFAFSCARSLSASVVLYLACVCVVSVCACVSVCEFGMCTVMICLCVVCCWFLV